MESLEVKTAYKNFNDSRAVASASLKTTPLAVSDLREWFKLSSSTDYNEAQLS